MTLLIIFAIISLLVASLAAWSETWDKGAAFMAGLFISGLPLILIFAIVQAVGINKYEKVENVTFSQNIASLNDGTGVEGRMYGGLFVMSGYINDTQHFAYYINNGNGSYNLEKRNATMSTIWTDATPTTARVDITDSVTSCKHNTWWLALCNNENRSFAHADFHIPPNSIKNDFVLDAQ